MQTKEPIECYLIVSAIAKAIAEDKWFCPVSWKGTGHAFTVENDRVLYVPTGRGGVPATMPSASDLCCCWEVISPDVVNNER